MSEEEGGFNGQTHMDSAGSTYMSSKVQDAGAAEIPFHNWLGRGLLGVSL